MVLARELRIVNVAARQRPAEEMLREERTLSNEGDPKALAVVSCTCAVIFGNHNTRHQRAQTRAERSIEEVGNT